MYSSKLAIVFRLRRYAGQSWSSVSAPCKKSPPIMPLASDNSGFSASGCTFPVAVELHRAAAEGEVGGRLELLHERCRARARPELAAFGDGLVRMREDHRDGPHQLVHGMRAGDEDPRVV